MTHIRVNFAELERIMKRFQVYVLPRQLTCSALFLLDGRDITDSQFIYNYLKEHRNVILLFCTIVFVRCHGHEHRVLHPRLTFVFLLLTLLASERASWNVGVRLTHMGPVDRSCNTIP